MSSDPKELGYTPRLERARAALDEAEHRVSVRSWSKGSSRGAGPSKASGAVGVLTPEARKGLLAGAVPSHTCGCRMVLCADCEEWICRAPGHARHVCAAFSQEVPCAEKTP